MDFSADGRYLIASCEFAGALIKVDVAKSRNSSVVYHSRERTPCRRT